MPSLQLLQLTEHGRSFMASRRKTLLLATGIVVAGGTVAYVQSRLSHKKHDAIGHYNGLNDNEETTEKVVTNDHKLKKPPRKKGGLKSLQVLAAILLSEMGQMGVRDLLALVSIVELFEGHYFCQAQREDFFQRAKPYNDHPTILRLPGKVLLQSR
ncbi:ABC transporter D family member 1-like isoform X1 [Prunus dulcis]|uniref:ABC transporter D family member 1-like isoform X1 n=1 Tax=Prunus dulcis TaxID=3755 RepID=UPI0014823867|nr:ABC transporter D family member 1-like isoform X1 [Prunus dulcis]